MSYLISGSQKPFCKIGVSAILSSFALSSLLISNSVHAKEEQASSEKKVLVTGSRIKKVDINELSPILSISREDIDKQGYATVKDVIAGLAQNTGGTIDNSFTFGFTPGASSVNLRGVGFGHTLVLIDGRRLPMYPIGIGGALNFVDLSAIPMAFVERIDVLTDGASAIYGSDAVSGVINIITRKDIEGISMSYRFGDTSEGGYESHRYNLMTGARNGDTQLDLIFDIWSQKALWATQRDYAASDVANSRGRYSISGASFLGLETGQVYQHPDCGTENDPIGGNGKPDVRFSYFNPGEIWCGFDRAPYRQLVAPQDRFSLMSRLSYEINPSLSFISRIGYSYANMNIQMEPNFYGGSLFNGYGSAVPNYGAILRADAINNPTRGTGYDEVGVFVRRLVEFGPRTTEIDEHSINLLTGLKGDFADGKYDWELGISYNRTDLDQDRNSILLSGLNAAVDNGLDLFEPIPQNVVNALGYTANRNSNSSNQVVDFSLSGDLPFGFDAGPVQFAIALERVAEKYKDIPDPLVMQGDAFDGVSSGRGERKHLGLGAELSFPFSESFDMDIAIRWDDYNDESNVNSAVSPKVAFGYKMFDSFFTRLSWGKSFRAPDMQRLFGGQTRSFIDVQDPLFLIDENGNSCSGMPSDACQPALVQSVNFLVTSNIDLEEEKGSNLSFGAIWELTEQFSVTIDYFDIKIDDVVTTLTAQSLVDSCVYYELFCEFIQRDSAGTLYGNGAYIEAQAINFVEWDTQGIDVVFNYEWQNTTGKWSTALSVTKVDKFQTQFKKEFGKLENVGLGLLPEYRANLLVDWQLENLGMTVRVNYIDKVGGYYCTPCQEEQFIDSWLTSNINMRYAFSDYIRVHLGVNNVSNEAPPEDPSQTVWPWFPVAAGYHSAIGRELYIQIESNF
ncbi:TonB-dependent receptor plug domain-containing protein [Aliikangiella sp. IMCC44359]|uniref:TonB-dependent receptor plug domain-containing protein n=1 Tax=Aliikangiella sp. IMCC44359 TaxID=3459125 RepID=UPI00403AD743